MQLEIPALRPALFDEKFQDEVDELRRFRHVFRNLYKSRLNPEKIAYVQKNCSKTAERFAPYHEKFVGWLSELIRVEEQL